MIIENVLLDNRGNTYALSPFRRVFCIMTGGYLMGLDSHRVVSHSARASNPGPTAPSKSWNRRFAGQQGNELPGIGAVSISGDING